LAANVSGFPFEANAICVPVAPLDVCAALTTAGPSNPSCQPAADCSGSMSASQYVTPLVGSVPGTMNVNAGA
jgi:hypothetical protein